MSVTKDEFLTSQGLETLDLTASGQLCSGAGVLYGTRLSTAGGNGTAIFYDSVGRTVKVLDSLAAVSNTSMQHVWEKGISFNEGLYVVIAGTTPHCGATWGVAPTGIYDV